MLSCFNFQHRLASMVYLPTNISYIPWCVHIAHRPHTAFIGGIEPQSEPTTLTHSPLTVLSCAEVGGRPHRVQLRHVPGAARVVFLNAPLLRIAQRPQQETERRRDETERGPRARMEATPLKRTMARQWPVARCREQASGAH